MNSAIPYSVIAFRMDFRNVDLDSVAVSITRCGLNLSGTARPCGINGTFRKCDAYAAAIAPLRPGPDTLLNIFETSYGLK